MAGGIALLGLPGRSSAAEQLWQLAESAVKLPRGESPRRRIRIYSNLWYATRYMVCILDCAAPIPLD